MMIRKGLSMKTPNQGLLERKGMQYKMIICN